MKFGVQMRILIGEWSHEQSLKFWDSISPQWVKLCRSNFMYKLTLASSLLWIKKIARSGRDASGAKYRKDNNKTVINVDCVQVKSNHWTMCDSKAKSECIPMKLCTLVSECICEITTRFHKKTLFDSGVTNI